MNPKVEKAEALIADGMTVTKAAKKVGIHISTIYGARKKGVKMHQFPRRARKPKQKSGQMIAIIGSPAEVLEVLNHVKK